MSIKHNKKEFGIYHWDTFDNETFLIDEADTEQEAENKIKDRYGDRIHPNGADRVEIVDSKGDVIKKFSVK